MKLIVVIIAAAMVVFVGGSTPLSDASGTLQPGPSKITLQAIAQGEEVDGGTTTVVYSLFNRPTYSHRLGTSVVICRTAQAKWQVCRNFLRLSRGTLITEGLFPIASSFRVYAVTGGTGLYANAGGTLTVQPTGNKTFFLTAQIDAF